MQCSFIFCGMDDVSRRTYTASGTWIVLQCRAWRGRRSDAGVASISPALDFRSTVKHPRYQLLRIPVRPSLRDHQFWPCAARRYMPSSIHIPSQITLQVSSAKLLQPNCVSANCHVLKTLHHSTRSVKQGEAHVLHCSRSSSIRCHCQVGYAETALCSQCEQQTLPKTSQHPSEHCIATHRILLLRLLLLGLLLGCLGRSRTSGRATGRGGSATSGDGGQLGQTRCDDLQDDVWGDGGAFASLPATNTRPCSLPEAKSILLPLLMS